RQVVDDEAADSLFQIGDVTPENAVPYPNGPVDAGEDEIVPAGTEGNAVDSGRCAEQRELRVAAHVPQPDRLVVAGGGKRESGGAESTAGARAGVAVQDCELPMAARIQEPHRMVVTGEGERVPIRAESNAVDRARMAVEDSE